MEEDERLKNSAKVESYTNQYVLNREVKQRMKEAAKMVVQAKGRVYPHQLRTSLFRVFRRFAEQWTFTSVPSPISKDR